MEYIHGKSLIKIAIADDHAILRTALSHLINTWDNCKVIIEAGDGQELIDNIDPKNLPDLILIDICMDGMSGYETIIALKKLYPSMKFLATSFLKAEETVIRLIKTGAQGFVHKGEDASVFRKAIYEIIRLGYFFSDQAASKLVRQLLNNKDYPIKNDLSDEEINFLKYIITEKTYQQIADEMDISIRHVEYLRRNLFDRFEVKNRTGLAVRAIDKGLTISLAYLLSSSFALLKAAKFIQPILE